MAWTHVATVAKDGGGTTITGGIDQHDESGGTSGPKLPLVGLTDSTGAEVAGTTADAAYSGTGNAGFIGLLKGLYAKLAGTLTVAVAPSTTDVVVTPTVTASAYTAGNVIGGILTFANILAAGSNNGVLQSITAKFKSAAVTGSLEIAIFKASPSNGAYADKTAPTWNAADMANLLGIYTLTNPNSKLGTMTIYNLDGIGKAVVGSSQSLYVVPIVDGTPTPASTSDFSLELAVLPG